MPNYLKHQSQIAQSNAGFIGLNGKKPALAVKRSDHSKQDEGVSTENGEEDQDMEKGGLNFAFNQTLSTIKKNKYILTFLVAANKSKEKKKKKKSDKLAKCPHCFRSIFHLKLILGDRKDMYLRITSVSD